jgi:hypothetical protein
MSIEWNHNEQFDNWVESKEAIESSSKRLDVLLKEFDNLKGYFNDTIEFKEEDNSLTTIKAYGYEGSGPYYFKLKNWENSFDIKYNSLWLFVNGNLLPKEKENDLITKIEDNILEYKEFKNKEEKYRNLSIEESEKIKEIEEAEKLIKSIDF